LSADIGTVRPTNIEDEIRSSYLDYAMSVIVSRALPDVRDGLKPVQRRILYAMEELGLHSSAPYKKSARIVGEVLGKYHPHGDVPVYNAMVRMAQDFSMRYPLIDGQGNFGSVDGDSPAAMRYTEARMAPIAAEMLADIDKDTVDFMPNFDGSLQEPTVLPARLPNLLLNGASGIAVGMATNIPPHNLNEICDAVVYLIDNPEATMEDLMALVPGPDFPTGGMILGTEGIRMAYSTGKGRIVIRSKVQIEDIKGNRHALVVTELPFQVNKADLITRIAELVKDGRIEGISDIRDESDRRGIRVVVELKRDSNPRKVLDALFKHTQLQTAFGVNMLALADGVPRVMNLKRILQLYIEHRHRVITRRSRFELEKAKQRAHILEGLKVAIDHLDEVISIIRSSRNAETARNNLMNRFKLTEAKAQAILEMQLRRLAALERKKIEEEYREVLKQIAYLEDLLAHPEKIYGLIRADALQLKEKYGDPRRTQIIPDAVGEISEEDLVPDVRVLVTLTSRGYIKRVAANGYRTQSRGGRGIKGMVTREQDAVTQAIVCSTLDYILFFTDTGKVYRLRANDVPDAGRTARGLPVINLINIDPTEHITNMIAIEGKGGTTPANGRYLTIVTQRGKIKRTPLDAFESVRSSGLIALALEEGDRVCSVRLTDGKSNLAIFTASGMAIRFPEEQVRAMGRQAAGVNAIRLAPGDNVVAMETIQQGDQLLLVTARGLAKRLSVNDLPTHSRGGKGVRAIRLSPKSGPLVVACRVEERSEAIAVSSGGLVIRTSVVDVPIQGRATQGVHFMRVGEDDAVSAVYAMTPEERSS
jgi:DNA gyrase subunit A